MPDSVGADYLGVEMIASLIPLLGGVLDKVLPDEAARAEAKLKMLELAQKGELVGAEIVKAEAQSQHWLAASWRPITMLTFVALIVARWFGWAAPDLSEAEYLKLWSIVEFGLGGYVVGRSAEKIAPTIASAFKK